MIWPTCQSLLAVLMMAMAIWGVGLPVVGRLRVLADEPAGRTLWALSVGSLLWGFVLAGLAVLGLLYEPLLAGLTWIAYLAGWYQVFRLLAKYASFPFSSPGSLHPGVLPKSQRSRQRPALSSRGVLAGQKTASGATQMPPPGGEGLVGPAGTSVSQDMLPLPYEHAPPPDLAVPGGMPFCDLPKQGAEKQLPPDAPEPADLDTDWELLPEELLSELAGPAAWQESHSGTAAQKSGDGGLYRRVDRPEGADRPEESGPVGLEAMGHGPSGWLGYLVWSLAAGAALAALLLALAPPTDQEALSYHLYLPKRWLQAHRLVWLPYQPGGEPVLAQMWFLWALALDGEVAAQLVHGLWGLMFGCSAGYLARLFVGRRWAWMAGAVVLLAPAVLGEMSVPHSDLAMATFCTLSLVACWQACRPAFQGADQNPPGGQTEWWLLAGLAFGAAVGIGRAALLMAPVLLGLLLVSSWRCPNHRQNLFRGIMVALGALAVAAAPWYLLAFWCQSDVGSSLAQGVSDEYRTASSPQQAKGENAFFGGGFSAAGTMPAWLATPWSLKAPRAPQTGLRKPFCDREDGIGLLWLAVLPGLLWAERHRPIELLLGLAAGYFLLWTIWWAESRLLLPMLPMLAPGVVWVWRQMGRMDRAPRWVAGLSMAICLLIPVVLPGRQLRSHLPVALGLESREEFLYRSLPCYPAAALANLLLPPEAKILSQEPASFYFDPLLVPEERYRLLTRYDQKVRSLAELGPLLRRDGFTHLLLVEKFPPSEPSGSRLYQQGQKLLVNPAVPSHLPDRDVPENRSAQGRPKAMAEGAGCSEGLLSRLVDAGLAQAESGLQELIQYRVTGTDGSVLRYRLIGLR